MLASSAPIEALLSRGCILHEWAVSIPGICTGCIPNNLRNVQQYQDKMAVRNARCFDIHISLYDNVNVTHFEVANVCGL